MSNSKKIDSILELLPHRYPFLLVDKIEDYEPMEYLHAVKNVTINEPFFEGHFPGNPVMPGVLMLEALAQAAGALYGLSHTPAEGKRFLYYFAGIDNTRFKHVVKPGDVLDLKVEVLKRKRDFWKVGAKALVGEELACSAELLLASKETDGD